MANQTSSLAHTKWMCQYHIVFIPKYRRKVIYNQYRADLQEIIRTLCKYKGVEILEGHMMPDHVHLLLSIPPKISVSSFMGYLKGKSALMMFDKHANLKYKFGNRRFWAEGIPSADTILFEYILVLLREQTITPRLAYSSAHSSQSSPSTLLFGNKVPKLHIANRVLATDQGITVLVFHGKLACAICQINIVHNVA